MENLRVQVKCPDPTRQAFVLRPGLYIPYAQLTVGEQKLRLVMERKGVRGEDKGLEPRSGGRFVVTSRITRRTSTSDRANEGVPGDRVLDILDRHRWHPGRARIR